MEDLDGMLATVTRHFPELAGAGHRARSSGWDCVALEVAGWTFKFPRNAAAAQSLRREARFLTLIRRAARLAVPDLELVEGAALFSRHRTLIGDHLSTEGYVRLDEAARDRLARDVAGFLADVHAIGAARGRTEGAVPVEAWPPPGEVAARLAGLLTTDEVALARDVLDQAAALPPDPLGEVFGQFDGHGWNMAFDHVAGRLNGVYDFGDAGIGALHRDFIYAGFVSYDLTRRILPIYGAETGLRVDARRIAILTGWHRLWELATAEGGDRAMLLAHVRAWLQDGSADAVA